MEISYLKEFVEKIKSMTCIISVDKFPNGNYGNIRIVTANKPYIDSIEHPADTIPHETPDIKFMPNMPYEHYLPKDLNFEDSCYRAAVLKQPLHFYIRPNNSNYWFNIFMLPLESDDPNVAYCTYSQTLSSEADTSIMANQSLETSTTVLKTCIKLRGANNFKRVMNEVIADIRGICDSELCCILLTDFENEKCSVLCESIADNSNITSMSEFVDESFFDIAASWKDTIGGSNCLIIKTESDMQYIKERNPQWYDTLVARKIHSLVLFPLKANDETVGYMWATNFDIENSYHIKEVLELTTFFLAAEISNYQLLNRMKNVNTIDVLTGVYNRNEMNNRVFRLCAGESLALRSMGVVFAVLNGLKSVNNNDGHFAGDLLLKNAAIILQNIFVGYDIYRAGGDEFMIFAPNITEEQLRSLVDDLREQSENAGNASFSVGYCYMEGGGDVRRAMSIANERMRMDKERSCDESL